MKLLLLLVLSFLTSSFALAQSEQEKKLHSLLTAAHTNGIFNGVILIAKNDQVLYQASYGYADAARTKLLTPEYRFVIGSIAKEFNSVGIMMLKEKGKLNLQDRVAKYLPEFPAWAQQIQIKHLLQYTSGLPQPVKQSDTDYMLSLTKREKLNFTPGESYEYSYGNILLQRKIIEKISGLSYVEFIKKYLFSPLKMQGVATENFQTIPFIAQSFDNDFQETTTYQEKNELFLNIDDVYKWSKSVSAYKLITKKTTQELAESFNGNEASLGEAEFKNGQFTLHLHQGSGNNYEALLYSQPENKLSILLLTNNQNFKVHQLKNEILRILNNDTYSVPKKSIYLDIRKKLVDNFNQGLAFYKHIKLTQHDKYDFANEAFELRQSGKYLMRRERFDDAIKMFHLSAILDLNNKESLTVSFNLIGESYFKSGNSEMAEVYYRKTLELDPSNKTAYGMLKEIIKQ